MPPAARLGVLMCRCAALLDPFSASLIAEALRGDCQFYTCTQPPDMRTSPVEQTVPWRTKKQDIPQDAERMCNHHERVQAIFSG